MTSPDRPTTGNQDGEAFSRTILDGLDQFVVVFDADGKARWWNEAAESALGDTDEGCGEPTFEDLVAATDEELARSAIDRLVETGELSLQITVEDVNGEQRPYEFRGSTFEAPENARYVVIGYVIADRRERERKLDRLRERTLELMATETTAETAQLAVDAADTIIEAPLSGVHFPDSSGEQLAIVAAVEGFQEAFGESPSYSRDGPPGSRAATVWEVFEGGEPLHIEDVAAYDGITEGTPTGSAILHPLGDHGVFIVSAPEPHAFDETDSTLVDILAASLEAALDRVEREGELRQKNDRLDRFTSIVSHDMRNPLSTAKGYLELARQTEDDVYLERVADSLDRMETLIDDMLTMAREGEESLDCEQIALADLAEQSWTGVETGDAVLRIETTATVRADASRLRQLFENLYRNSVEHGIPESQAAAADSEGDTASDRESPLTITVGDLQNGFFVADDGVGIPEDERDRVLLSGYSTGEAGTGLGLSIVEEVAKAHDWSVTVAESEHGGARFEFSGVAQQ